MASFWDLLPAGPAQQPDAFAFDVPQPSPDQTPFLPPAQDLAPRSQSSPSPITPWWDTPYDVTSVLPVIAPTPRLNPLGGILGPLFSAKADDAAAPNNQSTTPYGFVPKNWPAQPSMPLPIPDWQRPDSEFAVDSPRNLARIERLLGAGLRPDEILVDDPESRWVRDRARGAELLLPGSGNLVSGDWNNFTPTDLGNLLLNLAVTIVPPGAEARLARAGIKAAQVASEAETMAAAMRDAGLSGGLLGPRLGPATRQLTSAEKNRMLSYERARRILGLLDPQNAQLQATTRSDWLPSLKDIHGLNGELGAIRQQRGLVDLERHHEFVQQYRPWFELRGINPDDYVSYMWAWDHRLKGNGLHAGPYPWNYRWRDFIAKSRGPSPDKVHQQLNEMLRSRGEP